MRPSDLGAYPCQGMVRMNTYGRDERRRALWRAGVSAPFGVLAGLLIAACVVEPADDIESRDGDLPIQQPIPGTRVPAPLPGAHCSIEVEGVGLVDMEEDYLPHVIQCENGAAGLEALKAQAVAARSVAYYAIETSGSICDSQDCQVYTCASEPGPLAYQAVEETSGIYLAYNNTLTYGFYVAGDPNSSPPTCVGVSGATEHWVTYNEGQTSTDVEQTALGFVHDPGDPGYGQNRGCMSQNGAHCLEDNNSYDYVDILRFYYGDDIEVIQAEGDCVLPLPGEGTGSSGDPETTGAEGTTSGGGADDSTGGGDESPDPDSGPGNDDDPLPPPGGTAGGGSGGGGGTSAETVDPGLPATFGESEDDGGCACRTRPASGSGSWWLLAGLGLLGRVRRRR